VTGGIPHYILQFDPDKSLGVLNYLREVAAHVPGWGQNTQLFLFGRSFDLNLDAVAHAQGVRLVTVDDLYQ